MSKRREKLNLCLCFSDRPVFLSWLFSNLIWSKFQKEKRERKFFFLFFPIQVLILTPSFIYLFIYSFFITVMSIKGYIYIIEQIIKKREKKEFSSFHFNNLICKIIMSNSRRKGFLFFFIFIFLQSLFTFLLWTCQRIYFDIFISK